MRDVTVPLEVLIPIGTVVVAMLALIGVLVAQVLGASNAWRDLLEPYRKEVERLQEKVDDLSRDNAVLSSQRDADRAELGILRRQQTDAAIRATTDVAVLKTTLSAAGIDVPNVTADPAPMRSRATDRRTDP